MSNLDYKIYGKCFVIEQGYEDIPVFKCPMCNGTGINLYLPKTPCSCMAYGLNAEVYECRNGMMTTCKRIQRPERGTFYGKSEIYSGSSSDEIKTRYYVRTRSNGCGDWYPADKVFSSLEDAQKVCDKFNSKQTTNEST